MMTMPLKRWLLGLGLASILSVPAWSQIDRTIVLGDDYMGFIHSAADEDALRFSDVMGTQVSATVRGFNGLLPTLALFDEQSSVRLDLSAFLSGAGTSKVRLKKFPLPSTGDFQLIVGGTGTLPADYRLQTSRKDSRANRKVSLDDTLANAGATVDIPFLAIGGSGVKIDVKARNSIWNPTITRLLDPNSQPLNLTGLLDERDKRVKLNITLPSTSGQYIVTVGSRDGTFGDFRAKVNVKSLKSKADFIEPAFPTFVSAADDGTETGTWTITYTLTSLDSAPVDISALFDDPATPGIFSPATMASGGDGTSSLSSSPTGVQHTFAWSARVDFPGTLVSGVIFRILVAGGGDADSAALDIDTTQVFFSADHALNEPRNLHTSDLLPDGTVLVAGGDGAIAGGSHEIADFSAGGASASVTLFPSSLTTARKSHISVPLSPDLGDKILLVGGETPADAPLQISEFYDPAGTSFVSTGANTATRLASAAVTLGTDTVLVFGGGNASSEYLSLALGGIWTDTGIPMNVSRSGASATLLTDGRVLIAGGSGVQGTACQIFDAVTFGSYQTVGALNTERSFHQGTRLIDGRVLISGGFDVSGNPVNSAEIFDPATNTFTLAAEAMSVARGYHQATRMPDGTVLMSGGQTDSSGTLTPTTELFRPGPDDFTPMGPLVTARAHHTANILADGRLALFGGTDNTTVDASLSSIELFVPPNGTNAPPAIALTNPGASSGSISISYTLTDAEANLTEINVRWRDPAGDGLWRKATRGSGGDGFSSLTTSAAGTAHTFVWDSAADTGTSFSSTIDIEFTPFGAIPGTPQRISFALTN